jgi:imidazolonepropionase-like amidohydrolase
MRRLQVLPLLLVVTVFPALGEDTWLAIEGGTIYDGTGAALRDGVILVRGERIEQIGSAAKLRIPASAERIDARGKFILPGFVDLHFHYDPRTSPWLPLLFLAQGVTTQREMGNWIGENQKWLTETRARGFPTPRLLYTGPILDGTNPAWPDETLVLLDETDARRVTNMLIDQGATSLKVYFRLPLTLMKAVVEEADRRRVPVHGHLEIVDPRDAIALGLDGLEHTTSVGRALLPPKESEAFRQEVLAANAARGPGRYRVWATIDPGGKLARELIETMAKHGVNLDATLAVFEPPRGVEGNEEHWKAVQNMAAFTVNYHRAGGPVTIGSHGTVANAAAGFAFHREVEMHVEAGMTPAEAIQVATRVGAEALRLGDRGVLAPGKLADLVVLNADPLENISNLTRIHSVILGGQILDRAALLATLPTQTGVPPRTP